MVKLNNLQDKKQIINSEISFKLLVICQRLPAFIIYSFGFRIRLNNY